MKKQKQSLVLFHLFGMIITFRGLMKITGNAYGVLGSQRLQWSGVERGGGLTKRAGNIKHDNIVLLIS